MKQNILKLKTNREFGELLTYAYLYDANTIIHKDAGFSAHFFYVAQDVDSSTGAILDAAAYAVRQALHLLDDGWMVETNLISAEDKKYAKEQDFPDVVSALIDDARRFHFEQDDTFFRSLCYLSVSYVPTDKLGKALGKMMVDSDEKTRGIEDEKAYFEDRLSAFLTQFAKIIARGNHEVKGLDGKAQGHLRRLEGDHLITFLNQCISGKSQILKSPKVGYLLDAYLSNQDYGAGVVPKIGDKYIRTLTIDDLPEYSYPSILDDLNFQGFEYRWSSRYIALSQDTASKYLKAQQNRWSNKAIGMLGTIKMAMNIMPKLDEAAQMRKSEVANAIVENNSGDVRYGFLSSTVVVMHENLDKLNEACDQIKKAIESLNFKVRAETFNNTESYLGSLPGHGAYNIRKPLVDSVYVSHSLPTSSVWQGSRDAPCPFYPKGSPALAYVRTKGSRTFHLNLHVSDVGHSLILGPTGSGKSTLLGLIGCQFMKYTNARVVVFDKDNSNRIWLQSIGGAYANLYGGATLGPLARLGDFKEDTSEFEAELSFLCSWIAEICTLQGVDVSPEQKISIESSLRALAKSGKEHLTLDLLHVQDVQIRNAIKSFNTGAIQKMINATDDSLADNHVFGLETGALLKLPESQYIPIIRAVFHSLTSIFEDRRPTLLVLEEAWSFLRHKIFEEMIEDWLLTLRKFNVAVVFVSQNIDHVAKSTISSTIKQNCASMIYLPNQKMFETETDKQYENFGLNEQQRHIIGNAISKRDYYFTSVLGNRLIQLELDPVALSFVGVSSEADIKKFDEIYDANDPKWVLKWLQYRDLDTWAQYARQCYLPSKEGADHV